MVSLKDRRNSGRVSVAVPKGMEEFDSNHYDDWKDYRDGFRNTRDKTKIINPHSKHGIRLDKEVVLKRNSKLKKQVKIRKVRKLQ